MSSQLSSDTKLRAQCLKGALELTAKHLEPSEGPFGGRSIRGVASFLGLWGEEHDEPSSSPHNSVC
jgi:hypothetical protein